MMRSTVVPSLVPSVQTVVWEDIFAVVDDGRARPDEYEILRQLITAQAVRYPAGIGCLAIIPKNATPPSDAAREALNAAMNAGAASLRAMCWLVEGDGFQGAMVRAILTGLRLLGKRPYATHISTNIDEAVGWLLMNLPRGDRPRSALEVAEARGEILRQRQASAARG